MCNYLKPAQRDFKPEIFVLHVGTNDLFLNKSSKQFSEDIVTLAEQMKRENNKITISSIAFFEDSFKERGDELNSNTEEICTQIDKAVFT